MAPGKLSIVASCAGNAPGSGPASSPPCKRIRQYLRRNKIGIVIPRKQNERRRRPFSKEWYRQRNQVERLFNRLKQNRRVATRYEKRGENYLAVLTIAAIMLWL